MSGRPGIAQKRLSSHRFQQIPDMPTDGVANPNDVTIDIPLTNISSRNQTGARKMNSAVSPSGYSPSGYPPPVDYPGTETSEKVGLVPGNGPGRRRRIDSNGKSLEEPEDGTLTRMGRIYRAILNFSIVTRYFIYVSPIALLIAVPIIVGATAAPQAKIGGVRMYWFFTWIEVVWLSLWVSKIFAHFLPYVFQFLCGIVSSGTRKYALMLRALEIPISIVCWCIISLVTFLPIMTLNPERKADGDTGTKSWEKSIKNILFALLICSLILLAEKSLVQLISISYHRKQFDFKIKESKRNVYLLGQLYEASRNLFPEYCKEFRDEDMVISDSLLGAATQGRPGHNRASSAAPLRLIRNVGHNVGRFGDKVTAAFGNVAQELTGKQVFNPTAAHSIVVQALERKKATEALARRIWMSFVIEGRDALYLEDLVEVLGIEREAEAQECFASLDRDGNGDISLDEMILTVAEFGRTRKSISHSLHDVDQAIHVLDNLLLTVAFIICVLVFVSFVTSGFGTVIAAGATSLLSLSFVFATTAQEVLGSCIFLFVKHPFDVGDRVEIDSKSYIVERISLLYSVFHSVADNRTTQVPNVILNSLWIDNFSRANAMREQLTIPVAFDTTFADVQFLREEMEKFVRDKDNCRDFQPDIDVEVVGLGDMDKLELRVDIRHKSNWSNETIRAARRSKFMCALVLAVRKIPIRAPGAAAEAEESDDADKPDSEAPAGDQTKAAPATAADQEAKRLFDDSTTEAKSTGFDNGRSGGSLSQRGAANTTAQSEAAYVDQLNSRSPAVDPARDGTVDDLYRTHSGSSGYGKQLGVSQDTLTREPSTGRRKAGWDRPSHIEAAGGVPVIAEPVPPSRQPSQQPPPPPPPPASSQPTDYYGYNNNNDYYSSSPQQETTYSQNPSNPYELPSNTETIRHYSPSPPVSSPTGLQVPPNRRPVAGGQSTSQQ